MTVILCENFDINRLTFSEMDFNNCYNSNQGISFPNYDDKPFIFQTSAIKIFKFGMPLSKDENERSRFYLKLHLDKEQPACSDLEKMLTQIDHNISTNKDKYLGILQKNTKYCPAIRIQNEEKYSFIDSEEERVEVDPVQHKYCKFKFHLNILNGENETSIFIKENDKICKLELKTMQEVEKYLRYKSEFRAIVHMNKLWINKNKNDEGLREYGITMKLLSLEIKPFTRLRLHDIFQEYKFV